MCFDAKYRIYRKIKDKGIKKRRIKIRLSIRFKGSFYLRTNGLYSKTNFT
jgi:hypothetical protein